MNKVEITEDQIANVLNTIGAAATPGGAEGAASTPRRNFLRRTKATSPPETVQTPTDNTETSTNKYTRRGNSKFTTRKEGDKTLEKNEIENISRRPSLDGGARRSERPLATRKFVSRRRPGGANVTTPVASTVTPVPSSTTRRPFRIGTRRRVVTSSTTTSSTTTSSTTAPTTTVFEDEESLQEIGDTDAIEDPSLETKTTPRASKVQRRPLVSLKNTETDQNPQATNEEENKRQSKKFSSSIKQNELVNLVKQSRGETTTRAGTIVEDFSPETAVAIAAHQLLTAPVPVVPEFNDDGLVPTRKTQTTGEFQYTNREYNEDINDRTIANYDSSQDDYETTPYKTYESTKNANTVSTRAPYESTKVSNFDLTKTTADRYPTTQNFQSDYSTYESPKITTYDVPKPTHFPSTRNTDSEHIRTTGNYYTYPRDFDEGLSYLPKSTTSNFATEYVSKTSPTYVPRFTTGYTNIVNQDYIRTTAPNAFASTITENSLPKISTTLSPPPVSRNFDRTATTLLADNIKPRKAFTTDVTPDVVTAGYTGIQRGTNKYRNEKLIPVPVVDSGYSTVGYTDETSHFTREYLLESPVTKTYDDEYQYLQPITSPQTPTNPVPTRKIVRKKVQRKISTTQTPTIAPVTTTLKPRRVPAKPFEKTPSPPKKAAKPAANYDYYDNSGENIAVKYAEGTKVVMHENGVIECLDIGNFPHPSSCKKFISCARIDNGSLLGWEYICPKGLSFDPVGGICNWSAGLGCNEEA